MSGLLPTGDEIELVIQHGFLVPLCYYRERKRIRLYNKRTTVSAETKGFQEFPSFKLRYPRGLKADQLKLESRIMAVADICDALLASDRPYKKPLSKEKAFEIMENMAKEGKLDAKLVGYMKKCI